MHTAFMIVLGLYLLATVFYLLRLLTGVPALAAIGLRVALVACLTQLVVLGAHFSFMGANATFTDLEWFQLSALILAMLFIGLCFCKKFYSSGVFFITLIDLFCILSLTRTTPYFDHVSARGTGYFFLHLVSIFFSMTVFSVSLITATMFLLTEAQIKNKKFSGIVALFPPLETLNRLHDKSLTLGFILFTLTIVTGAGYAKVVTGHYLAGDLKQILSVLSWFFFAVLLNLRVRQGWQGHKGIVLSLAGFTGMILLFIVGFS